MVRDGTHKFSPEVRFAFVGPPPYLASRNCFCCLAQIPNSASVRCGGVLRRMGTWRPREEDRERVWGAASAQSMERKRLRGKSRAPNRMVYWRGCRRGKEGIGKSLNRRG